MSAVRSINLNYKILLLLALRICNAESEEPLGQFCNTDTNIGSGSQISANIYRLLAELVSKATSNGFIATSYGKNQDQVFGLGQCTGDVSRTDCSSYIQDAATQIHQRCPNQADARIWYDHCFLCYNNKSFIGEIDTSFGIFYWNVENVTDPENFNKELGTLMDQIRAQAVETKNEGLGKDLSQIDCARCLAIAVGNFETFCKDRKGCRVLHSHCYVWYELYPFFFPLDSKKGGPN
ncbi:hypothetical protein ACB094_12G154800 [Castanea mollissima]